MNARPAPGRSRVLRNEPADPEGGALLVHGNASSCEIWQWVGPKLRGVKFAAPDLRGFGQVPAAPQDQGAEPFLKDLETEAEALPWPRMLVGAGAGALLAGVLALRRPDLCNALLMVGPVGLEAGHGRLSKIARSQRGAGLLRRVGASLPGRGRFLKDQLADPAATDPEKVETLLRGLRDARSFHVLARLADAQSLQALRDVRCPVTVLWGERDGVLPPTHAPELMAHLPAGARLEIVTGGGHALPLERPELVADEIRRGLGVRTTAHDTTAHDEEA